MQQHQQIFESIFGRDIRETGTGSYLEELTNRYPYFSPAQFFALQHMPQEGAAFEKQVLKTNLLFGNPHWLHFQLNRNDSIPAAETLVTAENRVMEETQVTAATQPATTATAPAEAAEETEPALAPNEEKEIEPMNIALKMPREQANTNESLLFEPMHLVDYFASQGIKLSEETLPSDKLGKQLKSFTEWLKTMKKVHIENEAENNPKTDLNVQLMAENSNAGAEVVTEAMAEVYARQGKLAKAEEVYQKLSLLNPAKSTYFAAKLENLKGL